MRLFSKHLYHGTPHAFDKFDTEHIGTGEGAQVHGWGLYFAEDKDVADSYKLYLNNNQHKISIDGKEIIVDKFRIDIELQNLHVPKFMIPILDDKFWRTNVTKSIIELKKIISEDEEKANEYFYDYLNNYMTRLEALQRYEKILDWAKEHNYDITPIYGALITVEIPDDLVFAEERESIDKQPQQVIEALKQIDGDVFKSVEGYKIPRDPSVEEDIKSIIKKYIPSDEFIVYALETIIHVLNKWHYYYGHNRLAMFAYSLNGNLSPLIPDNNVNWNDLASDILDYANQYKCIKTIYKWDSFEKFYNEYSKEVSPEETSLKLESLGVNGIHYDGRQDGSCYVIFNPEHLKIINKE